jgi:pantothenate kinase
MSVPGDDLSLTRQLEQLLARGGRCLLGLTGPPGAGKSTLAQHLQQISPVPAQVVPMDGFHLANAELIRLGRRQRKGAPDTFDGAGYLALLQRLRQPPQAGDAPVYAPCYRREIEEAVAGAIAVGPEIRLIITEGNYLLLPQPPWQTGRTLLDALWYVDVDETMRLERLLQRHVRHGRSPEQALAWIEQTDAPNARLIAAARSVADLAIDWNRPLPS